MTKGKKRSWSTPSGRAWRARDEDEGQFFQHLREAQRSLEDAMKSCQEFEAKNRRTIKARRATTALQQVRRAHRLIADMRWLTPLFDLEDPDLAPPKPKKSTTKATKKPDKSARRRRRERKRKALRESEKRSGPRTRKVNYAST